MVEITDIDPQTRNIRTNDIFNWDSMTDTFQKVGESKAVNDIMVKRAWTGRKCLNSCQGIISPITKQYLPSSMNILLTLTRY